MCFSNNSLICLLSSLSEKSEIKCGVPSIVTTYLCSPSLISLIVTGYSSPKAGALFIHSLTLF